MRIKIVVDANVILSALLGGSALFILFRKEFEFLTTQDTIGEVEKYLPVVEDKSGVPVDEISDYLKLLPLKVYPRKHYQSKLREAERLIGKVDPKDVDILGLALKEGTYLWSQDKHFDKISHRMKLLKTENLV